MVVVSGGGDGQDRWVVYDSGSRLRSLNLPQKYSRGPKRVLLDRGIMKILEIHASR